MKNFKSQNDGFSTLELLIAMAVMTLSMTAVIMVAFGNQSIAIDTELAQRGLYVAQMRLEEVGSTIANNFNVLETEASTTTIGLYDTKVKVTDISPCAKEVQSTAAWDRDLRNLNSSLRSIFISTTTSQALGNDCATKKSKTPWDNPVSFNFSSPINSGNSGTGIDVVEHDSETYAILTTNWSNNKNTLFVINATDPESNDPEVIGGIEASDKKDFMDVDVYHEEGSDFIYAFVASASINSQLQVYKIDVSNPASSSVMRVATATLPQLTNGAARTIYYYDQKVYIGTQFVACPGSCSSSQNNELHIYNVANPATPTWIGSVNVNHNINDIEVLGDWAYLAISDNNRELAVIQINPSKPNYLVHHDTTSFGYNAGGIDDATTVAVSGQYVYLGRNRANNNPDFLVLKSNDVHNGTSVTDGVMSAVDLDNTTCTYKSGTIQTKNCLKVNTSIKDISLQNQFAFLLTDNQNAEFQIWDISNPSSVKPKAKCNTFDFPAKPVKLDFSGDYGYLAIESNDGFRVMYDNNLQVCMP